MGFFSFITVDTNRSIPNKFSSRETFTVYLIDNKGNKWREDAYEGYGVFGGKDIQELQEEMTREAGKFAAPILAEDPNTPWTGQNMKSCEYQGYFYPEEVCIDNIREDVVKLEKMLIPFIKNSTLSPEALELLRKIAGDLSEISDEMAELKTRVSDIERRMFVENACANHDDEDDEYADEDDPYAAISDDAEETALEKIKSGYYDKSKDRF